MTGVSIHDDLYNVPLALGTLKRGRVVRGEATALVQDCSRGVGVHIHADQLADKPPVKLQRQIFFLFFYFFFFIFFFFWGGGGRCP